MNILHILAEYFRAHRFVGVLAAVVLGALYGFIMRVGMGMEQELMTLSFIFVVPVGVGFLTVWFSPERFRMSWWYAGFMPWLTGLLFMLGALLTNVEGLICVVFIFPVVGFMGSVGGLCARIFAGANAKTNDKTSASRQTLILASFVIVPFLTMPLEDTLSGDNRTVKTVASEIRIHAPKAVVWQQIIRVPAIQPHEQRGSFFYTIGFPKPVEATLSHEGIGGVRHASFERGVVFTEMITEWKDQETLSFTIKANTGAIPPTTFDEHVTIGGQYFDMLTGTYRIEQQGDDVVLHLWSEQRLSTNFNVYAGLWTGAIMQDIQSNILIVIKRRCEAVRG